MTKLSDLDASPGDVVGWSGFEYRVMDGPDPNGTPCGVWAMHKGGDWITQDTPCCRIVLRDGDPMTQTPDTSAEVRELLLNLSSWIERRKDSIGPYADHIIHSVTHYEREIERLRADLSRPAPVTVRLGAVEALASYQQADEEGAMVLVSRQAIDECLPTLRALAEQEQE